LREFWIDLVRRVYRRPATCLITTDSELKTLNRRFRGKDHATDVLSFPSLNGAPGEIAISFDRAAEQAGAFAHPVDAELKVLMLHGLLHLAGMDHETDKGQMARTETRWRRKLGLPPGLVERA